MAAENATIPSTPPASGHAVELPEELRTQMEESFEVDFSNVQVYAECSDGDTHGKPAFTRGESIYIAPGRYNPGSDEGKQLLAHELTHVVQQRQGIKDPDSCPQRNAEAEQCSFLATAKKKVKHALNIVKG